MKSPPLPQIKRSIARGRQSYSPSELQLNRNDEGTLVFAYPRRSTKKIEQLNSLQHQADNIDIIIRENGIDKDKVRFFSESKSAYDGVKKGKNGVIVRKRIEFTKMLHEMDKAVKPCILLVKDSSRLSRNKKDNDEITGRLFGEHGAKITIEKIIFANGDIWDRRSDNKAVDSELLRNYHSSVDTSNRVKATSLGKLKRGILNVSPPAGLSHWKSNGVIKGLTENEKMPYVRKAFEMKMEGVTHKKIAKYLKENGLKTGERHLNERVFSNEIYIGKYTHTDNRTGEIYTCDTLVFEKGTPPISIVLWEGARANKGKKKDNYGDKQRHFPLLYKEDGTGLLKNEHGKTFSGYFQKGYAQYKGNIYDNGKHTQINVSEKWVIGEYLKFLRENIVTTTLKKLIKKETKDISDIDGDLIKLTNEFLGGKEIPCGNYEIAFKEPPLGFKPYEGEDIIKEMVQEAYGFIIPYEKEGGKRFIRGKLKFSEQFPTEESYYIFIKNGLEFLGKIVSNFEIYLKEFSDSLEIMYEETAKGIQNQQTDILDKLLNEGKTIIEANSRAKEAYLRSGNIEGLEEDLKLLLETAKQQIRNIDEKILSLDKTEAFESFFKQLPGILKKTFELSTKVLTDKENSDLKEDIFDLIKLTTFELKIKSKKALEIELC